jgi:hypothetical protein
VRAQHGRNSAVKVRYALGSRKHEPVALIRAFLKSGVMIGRGLVSQTEQGTPQGGNLSPVEQQLPDKV